MKRANLVDNREMIFGNSNHPVEVKKISIRIWKLRDEIESVIEQNISTESDVDPQEQLKEIQKRYAFLKKNPPVEQADSTNTETANEDETDSEQEADNEKDGEKDSEDNNKKEDESENKESEEINTDKTQDNVVELRSNPKIAAEKLSDGVCFLADINMNEIHFFAEKHFIAGQTIVIEFLLPNKFNLIAEVTRAVVYNLKSRVISSSRPPYRLSAKFMLDRNLDRANLRDFLSSIEPDIPAPQKKKAKEKDDDFDDLDL